MEKVISFIKKNSIILIVVAFVLLYMNSCSTSKEIKSLGKEIDSLTVELGNVNLQLDGFVDRTEIEKMQQKVMFQFLIYEDDIDKGKLSLGQLELKLESIRKEEQQ